MHQAVSVDLRLGDCLEILRQMPDNSVDSVITDPPYNVSRDNHFATMERYNSYKGIDFGDWDKDFDQRAWILELPRILADNANVVIFNSWQNLSTIADTLQEIELEVKRPIVLKKRNPMPTNRDRLFVNSFEFGLWATKGKWTFHRSEKYEEAFYLTTNNGTSGHPTEKHLPAIEYFVEVLTNVNDVVLDPFMGSGTTGVACVRKHRRFIGIEIREQYYQMAKRRITEAQPELVGLQ